jgi:hypothetical protein
VRRIEDGVPFTCVDFDADTALSVISALTGGHFRELWNDSETEVVVTIAAGHAFLAAVTAADAGSIYFTFCEEAVVFTISDIFDLPQRDRVTAIVRLFQQAAPSWAGSLTAGGELVLVLPY